VPQYITKFECYHQAIQDTANTRDVALLIHNSNQSAQRDRDNIVIVIIIIKRTFI